MEENTTNLFTKAYAAFNARDIEAALSSMHPDVCWPNGWEGGYVKGHDEIRDYWTRQWKEINPQVIPISMQEEKDGKIEVQVHQIVHDMQGNVLLDGMVKHIYTLADGKIKRMEIQKP